MQPLPRLQHLQKRRQIATQMHFSQHAAQIHCLLLSIEILLPITPTQIHFTRHWLGLFNQRG